MTTDGRLICESRSFHDRIVIDVLASQCAAAAVLRMNEIELRSGTRVRMLRNGGERVSQLTELMHAADSGTYFIHGGKPTTQSGWGNTSLFGFAWLRDWRGWYHTRYAAQRTLVSKWGLHNPLTYMQPWDDLDENPFLQVYPCAYYLFAAHEEEQGFISRIWYDENPAGEERERAEIDMASLHAFGDWLHERGDGRADAVNGHIARYNRSDNFMGGRSYTCLETATA